MSYFQYTKRDLEQARMEIGEQLAALAADTLIKINADEAFKEGYVLEDLVYRLGVIAEVLSPNSTTTLYPDLRKSMEYVAAYPILGRHDFESSEGTSGMVCTKMVDRGGGGEDCGKPYLHLIHS